MRKNYIAVGTTAKDNRGIFYDFHNKKFYKRKTDEKRPNENLLFMIIIVGNFALRMVGELWGLNRMSFLSLIMLAVSLWISTWVAYRLYKKSEEILLNGDMLLVFDVENKLEEIMERARKFYCLLICLIAGLIFVFLGCLLLFYLFAQVIALILVPIVWFPIVAFLLVLQPKRRVTFFKRYKKGKLLF